MADVTLTYKGSTIAEMNATGSKTLKTSGKYCEGDIGVSYVKPEGVTSDELAKKIITREGNITELPSGITKIGNCAFYNYTNLALTSLPSGITSIGDYAFHLCNNLALTSLPEGITSIGNYTFSGCKKLSLTSLPSSVTSIENYAFRYCISLTTLTFKGTPTGISDSAFYSCDNLTDIYVPWAEGAVSGAPWGATNATIHYNTTT